jgi:phytanoyl-CoA hydroxylase
MPADDAVEDPLLHPWRLHPWNTSFRWRSPTELTALTAEQAAAFDREGVVVLEQVVTGDELAELVDALDEAERETDDFLGGLPDGRLMIAEQGAITFSVHLAARSEPARRATMHPTLLGACRDLVGPDVRLYWDQAVYKKPAKPRRFPWHQDNGYTFVEPQQYLTCWIALTDAAVDDGCPQVVPGVHRRGTLAHRWVDPLGFECFREPPVTPMIAEVRAGDVVAFSSLSPHLTGPNLTDRVRKAYIVQYAPEGAEALAGDPAAGPPTTRTPCDDPDRQYPVLANGRPCTA